MPVELLILGAGWTSTFLFPLCQQHRLSFAATTRSGHNSTIKFHFDQNSDDSEPFKVLPDAKTVLITFPITARGGSQKLIRLYKSTRADDLNPAFIQLGATSIWGGLRRHKDGPNPKVITPAENKWYDRHSSYNSNERSDAEDELLALSLETPTTVLDLAGLYGGNRTMKRWVGKVAPTKEILRNKGSIHMIHGIDVARAIIAIHKDFSKAVGQRWLLTDGRVYDWWDLASAWGSGPGDAANSNLGPDAEDCGPQAAWVRELMRETGVRALPRSNETLGRALDSREFWETFRITPLKGRMEE
ncbi:hypothetical protein C8R41DRAFT_761556 [Lentinula lateritia]|uniref:Uncharacterized protein n=1 Tax=Lentinula lateritia TaxID=40482 RepID=A0ABQ8VK05_9AGAR|nr:hypothetical protein C8R41DRAFT_761556 [Lentinula lateritia]